jgi:hypothetical protein
MEKKTQEAVFLATKAAQKRKVIYIFCLNFIYSLYQIIQLKSLSLIYKCSFFMFCSFNFLKINPESMQTCSSSFYSIFA